MKFTWRKNIFTHYKIFENATQIGYLKNNFLNNSYVGEINNHKYTFRKKNIFTNETIITDERQNKDIGIIKYNIWNNKAEISVNDTKYNWKYYNVWNTKWLLQNSNGEKIDFKSNFYDGQIFSDKIEPLEFLIGLSIYYRFQQNFYFIFFILFFPQIMRMIMN